MRSEFEFIRNLKEKYDLGRIGDDCAVLPLNGRNDQVVTADLLVEDIDFRLPWATPESIGHKALAVSLSDIAAMGATPKWAFLSIGVPARIWSTKFIDKFYEGWFALARQHAVELAGGDVSRTPDKIVIDSIAIGHIGRGQAVHRTGARPGNSIFVTGSLGGAAAGLALLENGTKVRGNQRRLIERHLRPTPRVEVGSHLGRRGLATSMIDISDGLAADLHHLCEASNVGARIYLDELPADRELEGFDQRTTKKFVLSGGEDFELLFTSERKLFSEVGSTPITRIGEMTSEPGIVELVSGKKVTRLPSAGYRHF